MRVGSERADELATHGAILDGEMAQIRASTVQQKREEVYAVLHYAASEDWQYCEELRPKPKEKLTIVDKTWKQRGIARSGARLQANIVA